MINMEDVKELGKQILSKALTTGLVIFASNNGVDLLLNYIWSPTPPTLLAFKSLSILVAYGVWTKAIVPFVVSLMTDNKTAGRNKIKPNMNKTKNRFELF